MHRWWGAASYLYQVLQGKFLFCILAKIFGKLRENLIDNKFRENYLKIIYFAKNFSKMNIFTNNFRENTIFLEREISQISIQYVFFTMPAQRSAPSRPKFTPSSAKKEHKLSAFASGLSECVGRPNIAYPSVQTITQSYSQINCFVQMISSQCPAAEQNGICRVQVPNA